MVEWQGRGFGAGPGACFGGKEGAEGTVLGAECPGNKDEDCHENEPDGVAHTIAMQCPRCSRACHIEEGTGIGPFLEPGETWHK